MAQRSAADIEKVRGHVEGVRKLADRVVGIGPFGVGIDGLLAFVPILSPVWSAGAAGWLLMLAHRAKASPWTMAKMAGYMGLDVATDAVPIVGGAVDFLFPGHLMAARALQKEMAATHFVEGREADARENGDHERHLATVKADRKLKRIVYLHD